MILTVERSEKHFTTCILFDDTGCVVTHKIRKAILCFSRDGCDECGLHDDLELDVCNLVDDAGLVEIMCATRCSGTSRRVLELDLV